MMLKVTALCSLAADVSLGPFAEQFPEVKRLNRHQAGAIMLLIYIKKGKINISNHTSTCSVSSNWSINLLSIPRGRTTYDSTN